MSPRTGQNVVLALGLMVFFANHSAAAGQPVSVYFDDQFRGYDGLWSTAQVGVGTQPQYLSLLPNTVSSETWVAGPGGCDGTLTCQQARGGIFYSSRSTTWDELGSYEMGYLLAPTALSGQYGFDTLTISESVSASNQTISVYNTTQLWLGSLGLNVKNSQFDDGVPRLSFISSLVHNESDIPSNSYGYTAGAYYSERSIPGSLTLGGTDVTRYTPNSINFRLNSENYEPVLAVRSVSVTSSTQPTAIPVGWSTNPLTLMSQQDAATFVVDSSTPFLWFPATVCDRFASALNLTYNSALNLYTYAASTSPQNLTNLNLVFSFTLSESTTSETTVSIPVSYNAFNLQLRYPFPGLNATAASAPVNYFPLRRASSPLQYIIGRSFLQESYLSVDYERGMFSLSAAVFPDLAAVKPVLVPITRPVDSAFPGPLSVSSSLSTGAKAGIGVGVAVTLVLIAGLLVFFVKRRHRLQAKSEKGKTKKRSFNLLKFVKQRMDSSNTVTELPADKRHPKEMQADATNTRFELPGGGNPVEMPAGDIPDSYLQKVQELAEKSPLPNDTRPRSIEKGAVVTQIASSERSQSPVPPYVAPDVGNQTTTTSSNGADSNTNNSSAVSPTSQQYGSGFHASHSSGEQAISPIAQNSIASDTFPTSESSTSTHPMTRSLAGSQHQPSSSLNSQARNSLHSARASVHQGHGPLRTLSRSSRFREELTEDDSPQRAEVESPRLLRQRFSWEQ